MLPNQEEQNMGKNEKMAYLEEIRLRYRKGNKKLKTKILDEFCAVCGYHRKYALKLLWSPFRRKEPKPKPRGRKSVYAVTNVLTPLKNIWLATDQMCSKKLKAALPFWLPFYEESYGDLAKDVKDKLLKISAATIDRLLRPSKAIHKKKGLCGTKPGSLLKNQIPIKTDNWDIKKPGFCEADTVAHCGNSLCGDFAWSITLTDIYCCWTENRAVWGKGAGDIVKQIENIEKNLPFKLLGFDCDNGSEFLNYHLMRYFSARPKEQMVQFTRSRPYHKNDNAHVEQKNWTHVRQLFGYDRFNKQALIPLMNDLYSNECSLLQNYFYPTMKLISKERINSKYRKKYDVPKTPYHRLLASDHISNTIKQKLIQTYGQLNPLVLQNIIRKKLNHIFRCLNSQVY